MTHVHFIAIGGSGLSAIARVLLEKGYTVSGSDQISSQFTNELAALGAHVEIGHRAENVTGADLVIRSSAVKDDNPEVQAALAARIPVMKRSEFLDTLTAGKHIIAVAGTHGKTTTTAMLAWVLTKMNLDPSYVIGGVSKNLKKNAHAGNGEYFVIEADEYDRMFLGLHPDAVVITNMELDHPDCFPTEQVYIEAFAQFVSQLKPGSRLLLCKDRPETACLSSNIPAGAKVYTYGTSQEADYYASQIEVNNSGNLSFAVIYKNDVQNTALLGECHLQVPGNHNVRNALAVLAVIHQLGMSVPEAIQALGEYQGTERRFDMLGEACGITIIDDYAHHPTEIKTTLEAARLRYGERKLWVLWQPHTYSRTQTLLDQYIQAFEQADQVVVSEVYAAREKNPGFTSRLIVDRMPAGKSYFVEHLSQAAPFLLSRIACGDVLLVFSAGNANQVSVEVFEALKTREKQNG